MNAKFEKFYRMYLYMIPRCENRKQAWRLAERMWERKTGKRYYKTYNSFKKNMSRHLKQRG